MKIIEKIVLSCLSVCVLVMGTLIFPAVAESETELVTSQTSGGTNIIAETVVIPSPNFTVTVPSAIPIGDIIKSEDSSIKSAQFTVSVSGFQNLDGKQVKVVLSTPYNAFNMYSNNGDVLPYEVFNTATAGEGTPIAINGTFYTFQAAGNVTGHVEVDQYDIPAEGDYGGVLTFTFKVEEQTAQ